MMCSRRNEQRGIIEVGIKVLRLACGAAVQTVDHSMSMITR